MAEISTITGKPQPSFDEKVSVAKGLGRVLDAYNPVRQFRELDETLGGVIKGDIAYNDPRAVGAAFTLAAAPMTLPGGGGGVANIGRQAAKDRLKSEYQGLVSSSSRLDETFNWNLERVKSQHNMAREDYLKTGDKATKKIVDNYEQYIKTLENMGKNPESRHRVAHKALKRAHEAQLENLDYTPQRLLDPISDVSYGSRSDFNTPNVGGSTRLGGNIIVNPLSDARRIFAHEGGHLLEKELSNPVASQMAGKSPVEIERHYRAKVNRGMINHAATFKDPVKAREWYDLNYNKLPSERHAEKISKWANKYMEKHKGKEPSKEKFFQKWDEYAESILQDTKKNAPELLQLGTDQAGYFAKKTGVKEYMYETTYSKVPDSLLGISKDPMKQKGYNEHPSFKTEVPVTVKHGEHTHFDAVKGRNVEMAKERAKRNWPDAEVVRRFSQKRFQNTQEAVEYGSRANKNQKQLLDAARQESLIQMEELKKAKDFQGWMDKATEAQFYREALEAAEGRHPLQLKK